MNQRFIGVARAFSKSETLWSCSPAPVLSNRWLQPVASCSRGSKTDAQVYRQFGDLDSFRDFLQRHGVHTPQASNKPERLPAVYRNTNGSRARKCLNVLENRPDRRGGQAAIVLNASTMAGQFKAQ